MESDFFSTDGRKSKCSNLINKYTVDAYTYVLSNVFNTAGGEFSDTVFPTGTGNERGEGGWIWLDIFMGIVKRIISMHSRNCTLLISSSGSWYFDVET